MATRTISDEQFKEAWAKYGSPNVVSKKIGLSVRNCIHRKNALGLETWNDTSDRRVTLKHDQGSIEYSIQNGVIIVFSDAHFWPGVKTTMQRALCSLIKELKPAMVVCNGDAFDGGKVSRWARIGWDKKPSVLEELQAVDMYLEEIRLSAGVGTEFIWPLGNHDARYETKLAAAAPEFEGIKGFHLKDHFPHWRPCWTLWVNGNTCITHFYHSGIHAVHNNLLKGQCHYVTGHTHSLKVTPWTNAMGHTLWGVDTGCLAEALGDHNLDYQQGRHGNHRSGFAVLTFKDGKLLMPELAMKHDEDSFEFRGHVLDADTCKIV